MLIGLALKTTGVEVQVPIITIEKKNLERRIATMAKCPQPKSHANLWRIKKKSGNSVTIRCLVCDSEWDSTSEQYKYLPMLTEEEKKRHLIDKHD
mgnify:CR=1 FL=1